MGDGMKKGEIEAMLRDPRTGELLSGCAEPESLEAACAIYAEAARKLGLELDAADFEAYFRRAEQACRARTEEAASALRELPDDELELVSGGKKDHKNCRETYQDREDCWIKDGCDMVNVEYDDYICHYPQNVCENNADIELFRLLPDLIH